MHARWRYNNWSLNMHCTFISSFMIGKLLPKVWYFFNVCFVLVYKGQNGRGLLSIVPFYYFYMTYFLIYFIPLEQIHVAPWSNLSDRFSKRLHRFEMCTKYIGWFFIYFFFCKISSVTSDLKDGKVNGCQGDYNELILSPFEEETVPFTFRDEMLRSMSVEKSQFGAKQITS